MSSRTAASLLSSSAAGASPASARSACGFAGGRLVAACGQPRARLGQRRQPRRLAVEVAFARARFRFGVAGRFERRARGLDRLALVVDIGARAHQFAVDLGKPAALRQPPRRPGRRMRRRDKAVPAPQIALARDQPLAGLERCRELAAGLAVDHADLRQPAGKLRRRLDESRQRFGAFRQRRIGAVGIDFRPVHGRRGIDRRVEIVAERCAERLFVAFVDRDVVDHRRPQIARLQRQHLAERLGLGLQPLHALFGFGERARAASRSARALACAASAATAAASASVSAACAPSTAAASGAWSPRLQRRQFAFDLGDLGGDAGDALALLARGVLELVALRGEVGERGGQIAENLFGGAEFAVGLGHLGIDAAAPAGAFARLLADAVFLGGELGQRGFGVGGELLLALAVGGELLEPQVEFGDAVLGALLLAVEVVQARR